MYQGLRRGLSVAVTRAGSNIGVHSSFLSSGEDKLPNRYSEPNLIMNICSKLLMYKVSKTTDCPKVMMGS